LTLLGLIDNDVILKLASCDLFWEGMDSIGLARSNVRVLSTAKPYFKNSRSVKRNYPEKGRLAAIDIASLCDCVPEASAQELILFDEIKGIDPGETDLITYGSTLGCCYVVSGDKRWPTALANTERLDPYCKKLSKKVICLEQIVLGLVRSRDFETLLPNLIQLGDVDKAMKYVFYPGLETKYESALEGLCSYIADLKRGTGSLLIEWSVHH